MATARLAEERLRLDRIAAAVIGLMIVAAAIRFWTLDRQSFWLDESRTVAMTRMSFHDMAAKVWNRETTPPLYYVASWVWARVFGDGEFALRALSALAGVMVVPSAYAAGRALVDRRAGLLAAAFASVAPPFIWYSQEARSYSFLLCFSAASLAFFARALRGSERRDYALWAISSVLALASHYFALFVVAPEALWLLWRAADRRLARYATAGIALGGLAVAPIALHQHAGPSDNWIASSPLGPRLDDSVNLAATGIGRPGHLMVTAVLLLVAVGIGLAAWQLRGDKRHGALLALALSAAAVAVPIVLAKTGTDVILGRNLLPAWLPLGVAVAAGLASPPARWARAVGAVAAVALLAIFLHYDHVIAAHADVQRDDWRGVARILGQPTTARAVAITPGHQSEVLLIYLPRSVVTTGPARVRELYTIFSHRPGNAAPASIARPNPAFREVSRRVHRWITITRYEAARPTPVAPGATPNPAVPEPPVVLLQPR